MILDQRIHESLITHEGIQEALAKEQPSVFGTLEDFQLRALAALTLEDSISNAAKAAHYTKSELRGLSTDVKRSLGFQTTDQLTYLCLYHQVASFELIQKPRYADRATPTQLKTLGLRALGFTAKASTSVLNISEGTVERHRHDLSLHWPAQTVSGLILYAFQIGHWQTKKPDLNP